MGKFEAHERLACEHALVLKDRPEKGEVRAHNLAKQRKHLTSRSLAHVVTPRRSSTRVQVAPLLLEVERMQNYETGTDSTSYFCSDCQEYHSPGATRARAVSMWLQGPLPAMNAIPKVTIAKLLCMQEKRHDCSKNWQYCYYFELKAVAVVEEVEEGGMSLASLPWTYPD